MIHVVLDTSIYSGDRTRRKGPFRALMRLMKGEKVQLHVPYVVKHEFLGQREKGIRTQIKAIKEAAKEILNESALEIIAEYAEVCLQTGAEIKAKLAEHTDNEFSAWLTDGNAIVHDVASVHKLDPSPRHRQSGSCRTPSRLAEHVISIG